MGIGQKICLKHVARNALELDLQAIIRELPSFFSECLNKKKKGLILHSLLQGGMN